MSEFQLHLIEPRDPLIARDGRPFTPDPGARATSLAFPFSSTTTGGFRTRWGQNADGVFDKKPDEARQIAVRGPLLVELDESGAIVEFLAPAPLDCLFTRQNPDDPDSPIRRLQLAPARVAANVKTDCDIVPALAAPDVGESKPVSGPAFWHWIDFKRWLRAPESDALVELSELGHDGPLLDSRSHVRISEESYGHESGGLFGTRGLEFRRPLGQAATPRRLALAVWSAEENQVREGAGLLGGERRLMNWRSASKALPKCPCIEEIVEARACRVILLTPAFFADGWKPNRLLHPQPSVTPQLLTACVGRPAVVSGWDFAARGAKPTRRLAPAGSTYFIQFTADDDADAIRKWVEDFWMEPVSDDESSCDEGFGLAALGVGRYLGDAT